MYKPEYLLNREVVFSRCASGISSSARLRARWFEAVGVIISRKHSFLCSSFLVIQNLRTAKLSELVEAFVAYRYKLIPIRCRAVVGARAWSLGVSAR